MLFVYSILTLSVAIASVLIGLFVFISNRRNQLGTIWMLFCFSVAGWNLGYYFTMVDWVNSSTALISSRLSHASGQLITMLFLVFTLSFLGLLEKKRFMLIICTVATLTMAALSLTPYVVISLVPKLFMPRYPVGELGYALYVLNFSAWVIYSHYLLFTEFRNCSNLKKNQIKYFILGTTVGFAGGSCCFPLIFGIPFPPIASVLIIVFPFTTAYAITRYRLMDIQVIIRKGAYYSVLSIIMSVLYMVVINFSEVVFHSATGLNSLWLVIPAIFFLALVFQPLSDYLKKGIDKRFFRAKYESERIAKKFSAGINKLMSEQEFAKFITKVTHNTFKLKGAACYLLEDDGLSYRCLHAEGSYRMLKGTSISRDSVLITEMKETGNALIFNELLYKLAQETDPRKINSLIADMTVRHFALLVPAISAKRDVKLLGFLATDEKNNSDMFSTDEITLLETLSNQTVTGLENSLFYKDQIKRTEKAMAHEKQASLGQATAGVAHETKNALGYVIGFAQLLPYSVDKKEFMDTAVRAFPTEVERIKVILSGIIDYSKDEVQDKQHVQVKKLVDDTTVLVRDRAKGANVMIETNIDPGLHMFADPNRMKQVLLNLYMNSLDAMPSGGGILRTFTDAHKGNVYIKVSDTGSGMPQEVVEKIYEPFFTTKDQGTGLGLAIAKKIIEENQGKLYVESKEGEGTTFIIEIPEAELVTA